MKKINFVLKTLVLVTVFAFSNCQNSTGQNATLLAPDIFEKKITEPNVQLVDVRTPEEFATGHIGNASNINFRTADFKNLMEKLDKTKPVAVYCGVGGRSGKTVKMLAEMGFKSVFDLEGGITAWQGKGKKVNL